MRALRPSLGLFTILGSFLIALPAHAASITYQHKHFLFTITIDKSWNAPHEQWFFHDVPAMPTFCSDDCQNVQIPEGWSKKMVDGWNEEAVRKTLEEKIAIPFNRSAGNVTIRKTETGSISFEGVGLPGREVDIAMAAGMTKKAIEESITNIVLPVRMTEPIINVDSELQAMGIRELVTVGESDFTGSTKSRRHNVRTGLAKFNGHLVPQGETFSFVETLGPVTAAAGYLKELVIQGDRTVPDYGGGLCQVSSTAYRGVWEYGFPIVQRKNHSYTVSYYSPQGTDATVYPPSVDIKFKNDSPGALLLQTHMDEEHTDAFFIYYGTKDTRTSEVFGPYTWSRSAAPTEKRIEYTTDIPPGTERKLGERVPGMSVSWFRSVTMPQGTGALLTETYSVYQARPLFYQVGVTPEELPTFTGSGAIAPGSKSDAAVDINS